MRYAILVALVAVTGCASHYGEPSCGWHFECGRPAVQMVPAAVHQESAGLSMMPFATQPSKQQAGPLPIACEIPRGNDLPAPRRWDAGTAEPSPCDQAIERMSRRVREIEYRLEMDGAKRLPGGKPQE